MGFVFPWNRLQGSIVEHERLWHRLLFMNAASFTLCAQFLPIPQPQSLSRAGAQKPVSFLQKNQQHPGGNNR